MEPIKTLILTGTHNHDWERTTPFIANLMNESGRFAVDVTEQPEEVLEDAGKLAGYQLLFDNYNGEMWSEAARANFEKSVAGGAGLVIYHAANNAFTGWTEFEKMCGFHYREGVSAHGEYMEARVIIRDREHPITAGIRDFTQPDEWYHSMANVHDVPVQVLATSYSDPNEDANMGGSGKDEPVLMAVPYGEGRVFHITLGHMWPTEVYPGYTGGTHLSLVGESFQKLLLRGCEWAATGKVEG